MLYWWQLTDRTFTVEELGEEGGYQAFRAIVRNPAQCILLIQCGLRHKCADDDDGGQCVMLMLHAGYVLGV